MTLRPSSFSHPPDTKPDIMDIHSHLLPSESTISHLSKFPSLPGFTVSVKSKNARIPLFVLSTQSLISTHFTHTSNKCQYRSSEKKIVAGTI